MTIKEYVSGLIGRFGVSDSEITFLLQTKELNPEDTYSSLNEADIKKAVYYHMPVLVAGLSDVTEGGFSVKYNIRGIREWFSLLAKELGLEDTMNGQPKIRDKSYLW